MNDDNLLGDLVKKAEADEVEVFDGFDYKTEISREVVGQIPEIFSTVLNIVEGQNQANLYKKKINSDIQKIVAKGDVYVQKAQEDRLQIREITEAITNLTDVNKDLIASEDDPNVKIELSRAFKSLVENYSKFLLEKAKG